MRPQRTLFDPKTPWLSHGTPCARQIGRAQSLITQNQKHGVSPLSPPANYQNRVCNEKEAHASGQTASSEAPRLPGSSLAVLGCRLFFTKPYPEADAEAPHLAPWTARARIFCAPCSVLHDRMSATSSESALPFVGVQGMPAPRGFPPYPVLHSVCRSGAPSLRPLPPGLARAGRPHEYVLSSCGPCTVLTCSCPCTVLVQAYSCNAGNDPGRRAAPAFGQRPRDCASDAVPGVSCTRCTQPVPVCSHAVGALAAVVFVDHIISRRGGGSRASRGRRRRWWVARMPPAARPREETCAVSAVGHARSYDRGGGVAGLSSSGARAAARRCHVLQRRWADSF